MHKMGLQAPPKLLVEKYLEEIARTYNVHFEPDPGVIDSEVLAAEDMLIDFGKGPGSGGSGGMVLPPMEPAKNEMFPPHVSMPEPYIPGPDTSTAPFNYPPPVNVSMKFFITLLQGLTTCLLCSHYLQVLKVNGGRG